jgi:hypothetical protein
VMRMLDRDPNRRYPTGPELVDDLDEMVRETKYKSRHLPRLLDDLFGSGKHSSQLVMSAVSPELLQSMGKDVAETRGSAPDIAFEDTRPRRRSWRLWGALMVIAELAALALVFGLPLRKDKAATRHPPALTKPTRTPHPAPAPSPADPRDEAPALAAPVPNEPSPNRPLRPKRATKPRAHTDDSAIAGGRSIDPFAEAAKRGQR